MEATGISNLIQISQETANLLSSVGKGHWITEREDRITAKGKGELKTYFLQKEQGLSNSVQQLPIVKDKTQPAESKAFQMIVGRDSEWCLLAEVATARKSKQVKVDSPSRITPLENETCAKQGVLKEVLDYIVLPE